MPRKDPSNVRQATPPAPNSRPAEGKSPAPTAVPSAAPDTVPTAAPTAVPSAAPAVPDPHHPLRDIRLLWCSNAADSLGSQASGVVLPLLLLGLGYSPTVVGAVAGVSTAAGLALGPLVAVPADRGARKQVMFWSASVSALAMTSAAVLIARGHPSLLQLLGAVFVERAATACYEAATRGTVALIAAPDDVPRVVAGLEAGDQGALVAGPALGGALFQLARALPFFADALSYVVTAACVRAMRSSLRATPSTGPAAKDVTAEAPSPDDATDAPEPPDAPETTAASPDSPQRHGPYRAWSAVLAESAAGFRLVRASALLRLVLIWTTTVNLVLVALYYDAVFTLQKGGHGGAPMGLVLAVSGGAGLAGALTAPRLVRRIGATRALVSVSWLMVPLAAALAAARQPWSYGALFGGFCLIMPLATVVLQSRAIHGTPAHLQARAGSVLAIGAGGAAAAAPALAGLLTAHAGTAAPALGCAGLLALLAVRTSFGAAGALARGAAA